jgi:DNA repair protein RadC
MQYAKYAYRLETKRVREKDFPYNGVFLNSPDAIAEFARSLEDSDTEKVLVLYLNPRHKLLGIHIFSGTIDQASISTREICKHALLHAATSIVLVHNHPSGVPDPSPEDRRLTTSVKSACDTMNILLVDHVIVSDRGQRVSFVKSGILRRGDYELPLR